MSNVAKTMAFAPSPSHQHFFYRYANQPVPYLWLVYDCYGILLPTENPVPFTRSAKAPFPKQHHGRLWKDAKNGTDLQPPRRCQMIPPAMWLLGRLGAKEHGTKHGTNNIIYIYI